MQTTTTTIQLYVGTYGKYNNGSIGGQWVDLTEFDTHEDFLTHCAEIHSDEVDPEFMFQDCENIPSNLYSECSAKEIFEVIEYCKSNDIEDIALVMEYMNYTGCSYDSFEDDYLGHYDDVTDFTYELAQDMLHGVSKTVAMYFDYDMWHRDVMLDYTEINGHIFRA